MWTCSTSWPDAPTGSIERVSRRAKTDVSQAGLRLVSPNSFKAACLAAMRESGSRQLQMREDTRGFNAQRWFVHEPQDPLELDGKPSFRLSSIRPEHRCTLLLEVGWEKRAAFLHQLLLHVYNVPLPRVATNTLLLRAEWDFRSAAASHAQPHWHLQLDERPRGYAASGSVQLGEGATFEAFDRPDVPAISTHPAWRMHLAMGAAWHLGPSHSVSLKSADECARWLQEMTRYLRAQVAYLTRKQRAVA